MSGVIHCLVHNISTGHRLLSYLSGWRRPLRISAEPSRGRWQAGRLRGTAPRSGTSRRRPDGNADSNGSNHAAQRQLPVTMLLHTATSVHGVAAAERLLMETTRFTVADYERAGDAPTLASLPTRRTGGS